MPNFDGSKTLRTLSAIAPDLPTGYILEVNLKYPQYLYDRHTDLPFCPTRDKPPGKCKDKLLVTISSVTSSTTETCSNVLVTFRVTEIESDVGGYDIFRDAPNR